MSKPNHAAWFSLILAFFLLILPAASVQAQTATATVAAGTQPLSVAVNPVTNKIYVVNETTGNVTVITEQQEQSIPLQASITPLANNQTGSLTPSFSFTATSTFSPFAPPPDGLFFQVDTWQGPWLAATDQGSGAFSGQTRALPASSPKPLSLS